MCLLRQPAPKQGRQLQLACARLRWARFALLPANGAVGTPATTNLRSCLFSAVTDSVVGRRLSARQAGDSVDIHGPFWQPVS